MIDPQVDRDQRIDLAGIAAQLGDRIAHRRQIDHAGHAGEILQQHARRAILDLAGRTRISLPVDDRFGVIGGNGEPAIFKAQQVFEQHFHRERQPRNIAELFRRLAKRVIGNLLAPYCHRAACAERILSDLCHGGFPVPFRRKAANQTRPPFPRWA